MKRIESIDAIKGLAILSIIILHVNPSNKTTLYWATINQAVPFFYIILGYLSYAYFDKGLITIDYLKSKYVRLFLPLYFILFFSIVFNYIFLGNNLLPLLPCWLLGYMKYFAWGGYFITSYLQWVLLFPLIFHITNKLNALKATMFVVVSFMVHGYVYTNKDIILSVFQNNKIWIFKSLVITYLPHISLGMFLGFFIKKNKDSINIISISLLVSILSIIFLYQNGYITSRLGWMDINPMTPEHLIQLDASIFYSFFLFTTTLLILEKMPAQTYNSLSIIGKYSYEMFLIQAVFFQIVIPKRISFFLNDGTGVIFSILSISILVFLNNFIYTILGLRITMCFQRMRQWRDKADHLF